MTYTFLRSFILMFLVMVLVINLMYFFNINEVLPIIQDSQNIDFTDKYYGFSTLINLFRNVNNKFTFVQDYQNWVSKIGNFAHKMLYGDWINAIENGQITSISDFFRAFGLFMNSIGSFIVWIFYFFVAIWGYLLSLLNFILMAFYLMFSGAFASLPSTYGTWITLILT